jgi:alpha-ketoglutarate-dependent 2,4-dichlorophenoxyacetate dioxygenase
VEHAQRREETAVAISVKRLGRTFFAEVGGLDLRRPVPDDDFRALLAALHEHGVLALSGQDIDDGQQIAFSERFGPLEVSIRKDRPRAANRPEISDISNVDEHGRLYAEGDERRAYNVGNQLWHTDSSFKPVPAMASLLSGREVPPPGSGGETEFADLAAAWDALPEARRRELEGLVAEHSIVHSRKLTGYGQFTEAELDMLKPAQQAVVRTHPATGRKNLYLASHAFRVLGRAEEEGRALLAELTEFATRPEFTYAHVWRPKDLVIWDNRRVLHRGRPWRDLEHPRVMRRTTVAGAGPTAIDGRPVAERGVPAELATASAA